MLDILKVGGGTDQFCGGLPTNPKMLRYLGLNGLMHADPLFIETGYFGGVANPSSEKPSALARNIVSPNRKKPWRSGGHFYVTDDSTHGWIGAPCDNARVKVATGGTTFNVALTKAHYYSPYLLAAQLEADLNGGGTGRTFTVRFDGDLSSASPTYKWTIAADGTFDIIITGDASSVWKILGFTANMTGASTYTAPYRACHTEEWLCLYVDADWLVGKYAQAQGYRHLALIDLGMSIDNAWDTSHGSTDVMQPKLTLYTSATQGKLIGTADSGYTNNSTVFHLDWQAEQPWMSNDALYAALRFQRERRPFPRYFMVDLGKWMDNSFSTTNAFPTDPYVKLRFVDPQNPNGHVSLGHAYLGPGFYLSRNASYSSGEQSADRSVATQSDAGDFDYTPNPPARKWSWLWESTPLTWHDKYQVKELFERMRAGGFAPYGTPGGSLPDYPSTGAHYDQNVIAGSSRPVIVFDPWPDPTEKMLLAGDVAFGVAKWGDWSQIDAFNYSLSGLSVTEESFDDG